MAGYCTSVRPYFHNPQASENTAQEFQVGQGRAFTPLGFGLPSTLDMLRILFHNSSLYKSFNDTNYVCVKTVPDSTKLEWSKSKLPGEHAPWLSHALHTDTYLPPPPNNSYNLIFPPLGQKANYTPSGKKKKNKV